MALILLLILNQSRMVLSSSVVLGDDFSCEKEKLRRRRRGCVSVVSTGDTLVSPGFDKVSTCSRGLFVDCGDHHHIISRSRQPSICVSGQIRRHMDCFMWLHKAN